MSSKRPAASILEYFVKKVKSQISSTSADVSTDVNALDSSNVDSLLPNFRESQNRSTVDNFGKSLKINDSCFF